MKKVFWIKPVILAVTILLLATGCKEEELTTIIKPDSKSDSDSKSASDYGSDYDTLLIIDADSNVYHTVTIGTQTWLVENLRTRKYLNGDPIPSYLNAYQWTNTNSGACKIGSSIYGNLYNAYSVVDSRKICPAGWHIPTSVEWDILLNYLGGESKAGGPIKESGITHWQEPNVGATNQSGFTALPAGNYHPPYGNENIQSIGMNAAWWSSSKQDQWFWAAQCSFASTDAVLTEWKPYDGLSVRCIKGDPDPSTLVTDTSRSVIGQTPTVPADTSISVIGQAPSILDTDEPATNISPTGATLNGDVNANGLPTTVTFEYAYAKSMGIPVSEIEWQIVTAEQSPLSDSTFKHVSAILTGLTRGTYFFRVKAENSVGTEYGRICEVDILGSGSRFPTITTLAATDLESHTATLNATVNPNGLLTGVQFWFGTTTDYGADELVNWYSGDSTYTVSLRWYYFEDGVTYHYRASAANMEEIVYGEDMEFTIQVPVVTTLEATNVETASATLNGTVNASDLSTIVSFEYGTSTDYGQEVIAEQSPVTGNTITNVSATLTGLTGGTNYYYRVKAVNSSGTSYGENKIFNSAHVPTLTTTPISDITATGAISGGNISDDGGAPITERGICYLTAWGRYPSWQCIHDGTGTGSFTTSLTGLSPNTAYKVRSYAINSAGTAYGDIISFTTLPIALCDQLPTAATLAATNISSPGATRC